jgi:hypothetical protein
MQRAPKITRLGATAAALLLLALALASCGGSSGSGTTTSTQASAATAPKSTTPGSTTPAPTGTTPGKATAPQQSAVLRRVQALRACLAANGVKLPAQGSGLVGGLPPGVSRSQYAAALRKCAPKLAGTAPGSAAAKAGRGRFRAALAAFASCMRAHGIKLPPPSTAATGPIFDTKGLDTTSPAFKAATAACRSTLRAALPVQPGSR